MKRIITILFVLLLLALTVLPFAAGAAGVSSVPVSSDGDVAADGINTNVVTAWIIAVSAVVACSVIVVTIILAKKNKNAK